MGLFDLLAGPVKGLVSSFGSIIDSVHTSEEEKLEAKAKLKALATEAEAQILSHAETLFQSQRDVCDQQDAQAAHLTKRGSGGRDRNNLVYLCPIHHQSQEGRTDAFIVETNKDLWEIARSHTTRFDNEDTNGR